MNLFYMLFLLNIFQFIYNQENQTCSNDKNNIRETNREYLLPLNYEFKINSFSITKIQALFIIGLLEKYKPNNLCEYGAGVSTKIFEIYSQKYNKTFLNIEQDKKYLYKSSKYFPIKHKAPLIFNGIKYKNNAIYDGLEKFLKNYKKKFDFVLIDGPFIDRKKYKYKYNRLQMVDFIEFDLLDEKGYFLIHDTERTADAKSVKLLLSLFKKKYKLKIDKINKGLPKELTIIRFKKKK